MKLLVVDDERAIFTRRERVASSHKKYDAQFAQLVEPSQARVYRLALRITRNTEDAKDVQQETMLKAHRKLGQFEGRSHFTAWISRIAVNEALMCLRKRRRAVHMSLEEAILSGEETLAREELQSAVEGPEAAYSRKELRNLLTRAIANLRPAYRVTFVLRAIEQFSTIDTAKVLDISVSSVKLRLRRARSELRDYLLNAPTTATTMRSGCLASRSAGCYNINSMTEDGQGSITVDSGPAVLNIAGSARQRLSI
jgi:RNA polymerase sigma-70 factor (ECF subfamily)